MLIAMPKRDFPPAHAHRSRLGFYALHENSIEINSSFYKLPQAKTVDRWVTEVSPDFRFTFKLWKEITHQKNLLFRVEDVRHYMEVIKLPKANRGCLLVQFPPSLQVSALAQLVELLKILIYVDWRIAVEFRHNSWYNDAVFELLNNYQVAVVIQDMPKSPTPMKITAEDLIYLRFHGPEGSYKGSYSSEFLYEYATYIREWQQEGKTVYCYFNNTAGDALNNLNFLKSCLE